MASAIFQAHGQDSNGTSFKESYYTTLANLIYSPFKRYDIGLEYHWGQRKNKNGQTGHANRLNLAVKWHY